MIFPIRRILLAASSLAVLVQVSGAQGERQLEDAALEPLATALAGYRAARENAAGVDAARARVAQELVSIGKRVEGSHPLQLAADLGRAAWLASAYPDERRQGGKVQSGRFVGGSFAAAGLEYAYRLPDGYDARRAYPLVVSIPDHDERPADNVRTHWTDSAFRQDAIVVSPAMPAERERWTHVMVSGRPGGLSHVLTVLRVAGERFAVDFDRVYVVGRGKGVPAAIAAGNQGPHLFAGVIGWAGDADPPSDMGPENFSNLPVLLVGGGAHATAFAEASDAGECTQLPTADGAALWSWMQERPRRSHPRAVTVVPGDPFPTRAYWLRVAANDPAVRVTASIDRGDNSVAIQYQGASQVTLYLNDALLDLDRPLRVVANGAELELRAERHLPTLLDLWLEGTSDPEAFYVAEVLVDLAGVGADPSPVHPARDGEFLERLAEAGGDADALWSLHEEYAGDGSHELSTAVLRRIVRLFPDHAGARAALGHVRSGEHWFTRAEARDAFERSQDPAVAAARGYVQHGGLWMHPAERSRSGRGLVKDPERGLWLGAVERRRLNEGWVLQDEQWISPEEAGQVDLGLWKVEGEWVPLEVANRRRARPRDPWRIPGAQVRVLSTADRDVALRARREMERALVDLRRVFGAEPELPIDVLVLRDEEQYDRFAFGAPDGRRAATSASRLHFVHSAFLAESWFERVEGQLEHRAMGVCYFDPLIPHGERYGVHSARLAAGYSFVEALDPSPKAVRRALTGGFRDFDFLAAHEAEKQLPAWLRHGGAVYAERYFRDSTVGADGDPWWTRSWSLENLAASGGWRGLEEVLAFPMDPDDRAGSRKLLIEAGLVVAFMVDGDCAPVVEAHARLQRRLQSGRVSSRDVAGVEEALLAHQAELAAFAGW